MCSSPSVRAPKLQLAVEQLWTGGCWNTGNSDTLLQKAKKKSQGDGRKGAILIKSNPTPTEWMAHKLENDNTKEILPLL